MLKILLKELIEAKRMEAQAGIESLNSDSTTLRGFYLRAQGYTNGILRAIEILEFAEEGQK